MEAHSYRLPLRKPLQLPQGPPLRERRGVLLHDPVTGGWGDAAPLPGFSTETLEEVLDAVRTGEWDAPIPSLRFALSSTAAAWRPPSHPVLCNALWIVHEEPVVQVVSRLQRWPDPVVKVKPGREPDMQALRQLVDALPSVRLRIDGNRQWTPEQVLRMTEEVPARRVEYIEEPFSDPGDYERLWSRRDVPVALDESLLESAGAELVLSASVKALVLKPTLMGGPAEWGIWTDVAKKRGLSVIWSSCFESGVGLWNLAGRAAGGAPAGLDTGFRLAEDLVAPRPLPVRGSIPVTETLEIQRSFLCPET